jgi:hypothetical protein
VDPRPGRLTDRGLDDVDERRHIVVGDRFAITDRLDERGVDHRRTNATRFGIVRRHDSEL